VSRREDDVVSWLLLERYALGELDATTTLRVEGALARDADTRACLELIRRPVALPALNPRRAAAAPKARRLAWAWPAAATLAAAALGVLVVRGTQQDLDTAVPAPGATSKPAHRVKGDAVAISVVREHLGQIIANATSFAEGDRLKVLLTCPTATSERFRVLVQQGDTVTSPVDVPADFACGNGVAVPGAFTLTENTQALVCVVWGAHATGELTAPIAPGEQATCVTLRPAGVPGDGVP
jgi:hypothetical protein